MAKHGAFLWADLTTFRPETTQSFYRSLFGWGFSADAYALADNRGRPAAGVYEMPPFFQKINMPSFWMSYIAVEDVEAAVAQANATGAKVELGPEDFAGGGRYALIRDPLGAGFTVYEGTALDGGYTGSNGRVGHALFVSDAAAVIPFYEGLFGWAFEAEGGPGTYRIKNHGRPIADLYEIPDPAIRGKEEYWGVLFQSPNDPGAVGGEVLAEVPLRQGRAQLVADPDGGRFFLLQGGEAAPQASAGANWPWRAWLGLGLIGLAVVTGWGWISTLFFAIWIWMGLRDRATFLLQTVTRADHPLLYWLILGSFAGLGILSLFYGP